MEIRIILTHNTFLYSQCFYLSEEETISKIYQVRKQIINGTDKTFVIELPSKIVYSVCYRPLLLSSREMICLRNHGPCREYSRRPITTPYFNIND